MIHRFVAAGMAAAMSVMIAILVSSPTTGASFTDTFEIPVHVDVMVPGAPAPNPTEPTAEATPSSTTKAPTPETSTEPPASSTPPAVDPTQETPKDDPSHQEDAEPAPEEPTLTKDPTPTPTASGTADAQEGES